MNLTERLARSRELDQQEYLKKEEAKTGNLRAGNSGIMNAEGEIAGGCHRVAHLRQLGIELRPPDHSTRIMFDLGFANEDMLLTKLRKTSSPGELILQEEQIPIEWKTSNGTTVSGRPDLVICENNPLIVDPTDKRMWTPKLGLELKSVHSVWVARDCLFSGTPKMDNLIQSTHYAWKLGTPGKPLDYKLMYRQYSQQSIPKFGFNAPASGEKFSEFVEYNQKGNPKHVKQFDVIYDLDIDSSGQVSFKLEADTQWTRTLINVQDIERYFEFVSRMGPEKILGPELTLISALGKPANYNHLEYCDACTLAAKAEHRYDRWLEMCREKLSTDSSNSTQVIPESADK